MDKWYNGKLSFNCWFKKVAVIKLYVLLNVRSLVNTSEECMTNILKSSMEV